MKIKGVILIFALWTALLTGCRDDADMPAYSKSYRTEKASVTVTIDKIHLNPADRCTVTVSFRHKEGLTPKISLPADLPLPLIDRFQNPDKTVFRFDSGLPGEYTLPSLNIAFDGENPILTDPVSLNVYSETEEGTLPEDISAIYEDRFDFYLLFLIISFSVVLILMTVLIALVIRYFFLRRKLRETVSRKSIEILEALRTAVADHFDTLETDKAAALILQTMLFPLREEAAMKLMIRSFPEETIRRLRTAMEKYQKAAFARAPLGKIEMTEDLNFFIGFQKQFEDYREAGNGRQ